MKTPITAREIEMLMWLAGKSPSGLYFSTIESSEFEVVPTFPYHILSFVSHHVEFEGYDFLVDIPFTKEQAAIEHVERHCDTDFHQALDELMVDMCRAPLPARIPMGDNRGMTTEHYKMLLDLLVDERLYSLTGIPKYAPKEGLESDWYLGVHCNDTFFWASSDSEFVSLKWLPAMHEAYKRWDWHGITAVVSLRRGEMEPIRPANTPQYQEALAWLKTQELDNGWGP